MKIVLDICLVLSVISLNALLWAYWYARFVLRPPENGRNGAKTDANENEEEQRKKERLAKEWANMMNYNGIGGGGDE
nr:MAG TPA: hypothetical protein [Caudoviricetes sp.]